MERLDLFERKNFMKNLTKTEKLEKILRKYGMNFGCVTENGMNSNIVTLSSGTAGIITVHIMENVI